MQTARRNRRLTKDQVAKIEAELDYKNVKGIKDYITETGKIRPRRMTYLTSKGQRKLQLAIKRARHLALLPFTIR